MMSVSINVNKKLAELGARLQGEAATLESSTGLVYNVRSAGIEPFSGSLNSELRGERQVVTVEQAFPIYSVTKFFIAALILKLVDQKVIDVDQTITTCLPELRSLSDSKFTVYNLLRHDSGLRDYGGLPQYQNDVKQHPQTPWTEDRFIEETLSLGRGFDPGKGWGYSNTGYLLLKKIIERYHEQSFSEVIQDEITTLLPLPHTHVLETLSGNMNNIPGYSTYFSSDKRMMDIRPLYHPGWVAHGMLASTVGDLTSFLKAIFENNFLSRDSIQMLTAYVPVRTQDKNLTSPSYAAGLMVDPDFRHGPLFGHHGQGPGYRISAFAIPSRSLYMSVCANSDLGDFAEQFLFSAMDELCK